jgi:hypothetical protein
MHVTGRPFTNTELNNTQKVLDILHWLNRPIVNVVRERKKTVQQHLEAMKLPPNMHWIPPQRQLFRQYRLDMRVKNNQETDIPAQTQ